MDEPFGKSLAICHFLKAADMPGVLRTRREVGFGDFAAHKPCGWQLNQLASWQSQQELQNRSAPNGDWLLRFWWSRVLHGCYPSSTKEFHDTFQHETHEVIACAQLPQLTQAQRMQAPWKCRKTKNAWCNALLFYAVLSCLWPGFTWGAAEERHYESLADGIDPKGSSVWASDVSPGAVDDHIQGNHAKLNSWMISGYLVEEVLEVTEPSASWKGV